MSQNLQQVEEFGQRHFKIVCTDVARNAQYNHRKHFIYRLEGYINFVGQVRGKEDVVYKKFKASFLEFFANAR